MRVPTLTPSFLDRAREYYGDAVGVIADDGRTFTYAEIGERVDRLSNALRDLGVDAGDRVATISPNVHWAIEAMFAIQQLGAIFVPLNNRLLAEDYEYLLSDSGAAVAIVDHAYASTIESIRDEVPTESFVCYGATEVDGDWLEYETVLSNADASPPDRPDIGENDPATINYTSGTTGRPKGAVRTHRTDVWNAVLHAFNAELKDDVVYLWTL
ncbi:MAG: AMP-binding protein, partial [Salinirussus sp.]